MNWVSSANNKTLKRSIATVNARVARLGVFHKWISSLMFAQSGIYFKILQISEILLDYVNDFMSFKKPIRTTTLHSWFYWITFLKICVRLEVKIKLLCSLKNYTKGKLQVFDFWQRKWQSKLVLTGWCDDII